MRSVLLTLIFMVTAFAAKAIDLTFTSVSPTCHGFTDGTITANPSGGTAPYAFAWSNGQFGQTVLGVTAGTYSVTVTDQTGATIAGNVTLTEPAAIIVAFVQPAPNCANYQPVTAGATGGVGAYSYIWNTGATTATIEPASSGNVFVTVTDATGCAVATTYYVPVASQIFTSYFAVPPTCFGGSNGSVTPNIVGNYLPHTWVWSTGTHANTNLTGVMAGNYTVTVSDQQGCTKVDQINIPTQAPVQVIAQMTNVLCHGTLSGVGTAIGSGGVSPYNYTWSNNVSGQIIQNLGVGVYTVTLTDGNGCSATAVGTITEPPVLNNTVISVTPSCGSNGSITVQPSGGTPPYTLNWNAGQYSGTTNNNLPAGNYYICLFDANNCQIDLNVVVPGGPGITVNLVTEKADCVGLANGVATAVVSGGTGNYQYTWSNGGPNLPQLNGLAGGLTYTVTVVDLTSGCTSSASAMVGLHGQIAIQVTDTDVFCASNTTGSANVVALSGSAPFTYAWTVNGNTINTQSITDLSAGAYPVIVTDANGCKAFGVADIGATASALAEFGIEKVDCDSNIVSIKLNDLSVGNGNAITNWEWVIAWGTGSVAYSGQTPPIIPVPANSTGTVILKVSTAAGCVDEVVHDFSVGQAVNISINGNNPAVNCAGGASTILINGDPTYTYQWSPMTNLTFVDNNPQEVIANPSEATTYQVIASKAGCKDTLNVQVVKPTPFLVDLGAPVVKTCTQDQSVAATLNVPNLLLTYTWLNAQGDSIGTGNPFIVPATGTPTAYSVVATDAFGCSATDQVSVQSTAVDVQAGILPVASACAGTPVQAGLVNLDSTDILMFNWTASPSGITISDPIAQNPTISGVTGTYTVSVTITNQYGCTKVLSTPVTFSTSASLAGQVNSDLCNGLNVDFTNTSNQTGTWAFGDGTNSTLLNPAHAYSNAGTYIITFTPNDVCYQPFQDTIQVTATPAVVAAITSAVLSCQNTATVGFTDASQHANPIASWNWTFSTGQTSNQQNPTIIFPAEGSITATLVVIDINGCTDASDPLALSINIINESVESQAGFCPGGSKELNPNPNTTYTYNWTATPADTELVSSSPNPTVSPDVPTTYVVSITNGNCTVAQTVQLDIYDPADVLASRDTIVCTSNSVEISAFSTNATSFEWSTSPNFNQIFANGATASAVPSLVGMNFVRATTAQGCTGMDSVMVLLGSPNVLASTLNPTYICNGVSAQIGVVNNNQSDILTYEWSGGLPTGAVQNVNPTTATTYAVIVTNQYACKDTLSFAVTPVALALDLNVTGKTTICPGETVVITATTTGGTAYSYNWTPASSLDDPTIAAPTAAPEATTDYNVVVTDASGCTIVGNTSITVISPDCIDPFIFVPNAFSPNNDDNNDFFRVRGVNMTELYFVVWDRWGEKVYETEQVNHIGWDGIFKGVASTPDSYAWYARVRCGNGKIWEKKGNVTLLK
jgi:gliding motility-associated-like protein